MRIWATARRADDRSPGPNSLVRAAGRGAGLAQTATVSTIGRGEDVKVSNCARDHAPDAAPYGATRRRPAASSAITTLDTRTTAHKRDSLNYIFIDLRSSPAAGQPQRVRVQVLIAYTARRR